MIYAAKTVLCIGGDTPEHLKLCRDYIDGNRLTSEDAKIMRAVGEYVKVVAKREVKIINGLTRD